MYFAFSAPPVGRAFVTDPSKYLEVNTYTNKILTEYSCKNLPNEILSSSTDVKYEYRYECSVLGYPSSSIYLYTIYLNENDFNTEEQRITDMSVVSIEIDETTIIYSSRFDIKERLEQYTDDEILDGLLLVLDFSVINYEERSIEYIFDVRRDEHPRNDKVLNILKDIGSVIEENTNIRAILNNE